MKRIFLTLTVLGLVLTSFFIFKPNFSPDKMAKVDWKFVNLREKKFSKEDVNLEKIKVEEHRIKINDYDVFYRQAEESHGKLNVLLLHGMRFKSETWLNLKTIHILAALGYKVIAVDLPGYGESSKDQVPESDRNEFLHELIKKLSLSPCVIISPSLSGSFTIPLLRSHPEDFKAYIPVAPIRTNTLNAEDYEKLQIPTLILSGENDKELGSESVANLRHIPKSQVVILPKAGHAAYLDDPDSFHELLFNFLKLVNDLSQGPAKEV